MLGFKATVRLRLASPAIRHLLERLDAFSERGDVRVSLVGDLTITSGNDSQHDAESRHYRDQAVDVRVHNIATTARERLRTLLEHELNLGLPRLYFRVLHESIGTPNEHWHCQVRQGMGFPPEL